MDVGDSSHERNRVLVFAPRFKERWRGAAEVSLHGRLHTAIRADIALLNSSAWQEIQGRSIPPFPDDHPTFYSVP